MGTFLSVEFMFRQKSRPFNHHFHHFRKRPCVPLHSVLIPPPYPKDNYWSDFISTTIVLPILKLQIKGVKSIRLFCLTSFAQSVGFGDSSMLSVSVGWSFLSLSNIPLHKYPTVCSRVGLMRDICLFSAWDYYDESFSEHSALIVCVDMFPFLLGC